MKRLSLIALFSVALSVMAIGQDTKMWIGGSFQFSNTNNDGAKSSTFGIMPEFGYLVNSNFTVGGGIGFYTSSTKSEGISDKNISNTFTIKPFVRYTAIRLDKISIFAQADLPISFYGGSFAGVSKDSRNRIGLDIVPGLSYSFNDSWAAVLKMPAIFSFSTSSEHVTSVKFAINSGYSIQNYILDSSIGFAYKF